MLSRQQSFGLQLVVFCGVTAWWYVWTLLNGLVPNNPTTAAMATCGQLWFFAAAFRAARVDLTCTLKWYAITFLFFMTPLVIFGVLVEALVFLNWGGIIIIRTITSGGKRS